jgi:hypothetical protein
MKLRKYLQKKRADRLTKIFHTAIINRDAVKVYEISVMMGLNFTDTQIQDLFNKKHD